MFDSDGDVNKRKKILFKLQIVSLEALSLFANDQTALLHKNIDDLLLQQTAIIKSEREK